MVTDIVADGLPHTGRALKGKGGENEWWTLPWGRVLAGDDGGGRGVERGSAEVVPKGMAVATDITPLVSVTRVTVHLTQAVSVGSALKGGNQNMPDHLQAPGNM